MIMINRPFWYKYALNLLSIKPITIKFQLIENNEDSVSKSSHSLIPTFVLLVLLATIVPVANLAVPALMKSRQNNIAANSITIQNQIGDQLSYGDILYPYYESDEKTISFDFLSNEAVNTVQIDKEFLVENNVVLESDIPAILGYSSNKDGQQLESIYLVKNDQANLIWQNTK